MKPLKPIRFNDTNDYEFLSVLGIEGVFSGLRVDKKSLPKGFYHYVLQDGLGAWFGAIANHSLPDCAGNFITKDVIDLENNGVRALNKGDFAFLEKPFNNEEFERFFGVKVSLDRQIENAEEIRNQQMGDIER